MRGISLQVLGLGRALTNFLGIRRTTNPTAEKSLFRSGIRIMETATPLVPVDTGRLRDSWFVVTPRYQVHGPQAEGVMAFRADLPSKQPAAALGHSAPYASLVHATHPTMGGWMWKALAVQQRNVSANLSRDLRVAMGKFRA